MFRLSDIGKYRLRKISSCKIFFSIILNLFVGGIAGFIGTFASTSVQESVSSIFAEAASNTYDKKINFISTSVNFFDKSDFIKLYDFAIQKQRDIYDTRIFSFFPGYFSNSASNDLYHYSSVDIFGSDKPISLLPSFTNSINISNGSYKHEIWDLNMIFDGNVTTSSDGIDTTNFCYISKSSAERMLWNDGIDYPSLEDFKSLTGRSIAVNYTSPSGSENLYWTISNIFYEDDTYIYYKNIIGDFIPCFYLNLPTYSYPSIAIGFGYSSFSCSEQIENYLDLVHFAGNQSLTLIGYNQNIVTESNFEPLLEDYSQRGISQNYIVLMCSIFILLTIILDSLLFRNISCKTILICAMSLLFLSSLISWISILLSENFYSFSALLMILVSTISQTIVGFGFFIIRKNPHYRGRLLYEIFKV